MDRRITDPLLQQRETPRRLAQYLIYPTIAHHHLHHLRRGLNLARTGKGFELERSFMIVRRQLLQAPVQCRIRVSQGQAHRGRSSDHPVSE